MISNKAALPLVLFLYEEVMIAIININFGKAVTAMKSVDKFYNQG